MTEGQKDRAVKSLRSHIQQAIVTPWIGDPIDTDIDEEHLYPWIVGIVSRALEETE